MLSTKIYADALTFGMFLHNVILPGNRFLIQVDNSWRRPYYVFWSHIPAVYTKEGKGEAEGGEEGVWCTLCVAGWVMVPFIDNGNCRKTLGFWSLSYTHAAFIKVRKKQNIIHKPQLKSLGKKTL